MQCSEPDGAVGFNEQTAGNHKKSRDGIDKKFPDKSQDEKDYILLRVLGSVSYTGENGLIQRTLRCYTEMESEDGVLHVTKNFRNYERTRIKRNQNIFYTILGLQRGIRDSIFR